MIFVVRVIRGVLLKKNNYFGGLCGQDVLCGLVGQGGQDVLSCLVGQGGQDGGWSV